MVFGSRPNEFGLLPIGENIVPNVILEPAMLVEPTALGAIDEISLNQLESLLRWQRRRHR